MRPHIFEHPHSFDDALTKVMARVNAISETDRLPLLDAVGRVVAEEMTAQLDVPPFDRAAMDGFAVRSSDLTDATSDRPAILRCVGQILTGDLPTRTLEPGHCMEIATGAPVPDGADAVVMVERTSRVADTVAVRERLAAGQNIGRRGADIAVGHAAVRIGQHLTPARAGALAAIGATTVAVFRQPRVAVVSTGSEIAQTGQALGPGQIHDINSITLGAVVQRHGGIARRMVPVGDAVDDLVAALREASRHDLIVCSGGSSVGQRDLLTDALEVCGSIVFHGIAIKPGKPTLFGAVGTTPLFGMPGNPTSCLSNAYLLLVPFLRSLARLPVWQPTEVRVPLARAIASNTNRHQFFTVQIVDGRAEPAFKSSGDITSMADADGYLEIAADVAAVAVGELVTVKLF